MHHRPLSPTTTTTMDPSIWSHLPGELLDLILSLLPIPALLSLRPTSKHFSSLLLSPSFLSLLPHHRRPAHSFLLLSHPQFSPSTLPSYSSSTDTWRPLPLPASKPSQLLSSSSGLLLFSLPSSPSLLVSNLLTSSSRLLAPPTPHFSSPALVSAPSDSPHGYKIFLPSSNSSWVWLYDSLRRSWTRFPGFDPVLGRNTSPQDPVLFDGHLLFTSPEPFSVVGFDLEAGGWDLHPAPDLPGGLAFVRLVAAGKRLFVVGGVGRDGISRSVVVWEMAEGGWEEVGRLPDLMCRKFGSVCYHNYSHVYCLWHEGMVCVCCTTWPEVLFFKVGRGTWHWLPRCPLLQEKWSCGFRWFSFVHDLYALV